MGLIEELVNFLTNGSIAGLPPLAVMVVPLVLGLLVGFLAHKVLKVVVIALIVLVVVAFFGIYTLDIPSLQQLVQHYGPLVLSYGALLVGVLPLSVGFVIGAIVGFILG
jgi:uncharacterized membrane protein (Fun14 family)